MLKVAISSISVNQSKENIEKLRTRSTIRSYTPEISNTKPQIKPDSPRPQTREYVSYDPNQRKITAAHFGEMYLYRSDFSLVTPKNAHPEPPKPKMFHKPTFSVPAVVNSFLKETKQMFNRKRSYVHCLRKSVRELKSLNLTPQELENIEQIIPARPFQDAKAHVFLKAVKSGVMNAIKAMIKENPYIVHSYDNVGMTGLHWCALRARMDVATILINNHAIIDALDIVHRTPLFLAVKEGNFEVIRFFLIHRADPLIVPNYKKRLFQYAKKYVTQEMIRKAILYHKMLKKVPPNRRDEKWKNEIVPAFNRLSTIKAQDFNFNFASFV
jgi:hypothetical protein